MATAVRETPAAGSRLSFARIPEVMEMPYLLETQKQSYSDFLQFEVATDQREEKGLQEVFRSVFPINSPGDPSTLEFVEYTFGTPKYTVKESIDRGMTFAAPLKLKLQLVVREQNEETGLIEIRDIKEQEVYMGEVPLMTEQGTFIINGAERVIVSHFSPTALHPDRQCLGHGDAPQWQADLQRPHYSLSRRMGRIRNRHLRRHVRHGRPEAQDSGDDVPARFWI